MSGQHGDEFQGPDENRSRLRLVARRIGWAIIQSLAAAYTTPRQ